MEPVEDLGLVHSIPPALTRPRTRQTPIRPSERRRRPRQVSLTFSSGEVVERLRRLAERWEMYAPNGGVGISAVAEYLLCMALDEAEQGAIAPPKWGRKR
jgi:hypothetical protein